MFARGGKVILLGNLVGIGGMGIDCVNLAPAVRGLTNGVGGTGEPEASMINGRAREPGIDIVVASVPLRSLEGWRMP